MATSRYPRFDMGRIRLRPIVERKDLVTRENILPLEITVNISAQRHPAMKQLSRAVKLARQRDKPVILFIGGHVIKSGMSNLLGDLIMQGQVTHLAMNGAAFIHDFELSTNGGTSELVEDTLPAGKFGLWQETLGDIDLLIRNAYAMDVGLGEIAGEVAIADALCHAKGGCVRAMYPSEFASTSLVFRAYAQEIPLTVHSGPIGVDIFHLSPDFQPSHFGPVMQCDWLSFVDSVSKLGNGGVFINMGSAVVGPELFIKALSLARNGARDDEGVEGFTTAVFDLKPLPPTHEAWDPEPHEPGYYDRQLKNVLKRPVAGTGHSIYICGLFRDTIPAFRAALSE